MYEKLFKKNQNLLKAFRFGIERESLRITPEGKLSSKKHPQNLGSPLTHPHISTDFSEQQIEWNTPPFKTFRGALQFLEDLIRFSLGPMGSELLWPLSMPCYLKRVDIAQFGSSHQGKEKEIYRKGLAERYGENLQMISGIHYNFSFDPSFWKKIHSYENSPLPLQDFINEKYFGIVRNFLREGWILTYLFGASPAIDQSYGPKPLNFEKKGSIYYSPYATSVRTSHLGYYSRVQSQLAISMNDLESYLKEMKKALATPHPSYASIDTQLNDHILQIENEHYSRIRVKRSPSTGESPLEALEKGGVQYLEVRTIDLNPFSPLGLDESQLKFIHLFLLRCLFKKSPNLTKKNQDCLTRNQNTIALEGRKPGLKLLHPHPISAKAWANQIFDEMIPLAKLLGYEKIYEKEKVKISCPEECPSAKISIEDYSIQALDLAKKHRATLLKKRLPLTRLKHFEANVQASLRENQRLETASEVLTDGYEFLELSTQILIKEALKRKVHVDLLDKNDQLIRLEREGHVEFVKEATKTSKDGYVIPFLMENKEVTKNLLKEKGFQVPEGNSYTSLKDALNDYPLYAKKKVVVKPKSTNFGLGIHFVPPHDEKGYQESIKESLSYGSSFLVESFFSGVEYRFLVIGGKIIGVSERVPAHVIGDGKKTITTLVHEKNHDPIYYRDPKCFLHLGKKERFNLTKEGLSPESVPQKGRKIYLRYNSNVSTGGDPIDRTDEVHPSYKKIAIKATQALGTYICGVDIILSHPKLRPTKKNHVIIEMNYNPVLFIHAYPYKGKKRNVAGPLLDLLGYSSREA